MKRLILATLFTAAAVFAQTGSAPTNSPSSTKSNSTPATKKHHKKAATANKSATPAASAQSNTAKTPAK